MKTVANGLFGIGMLVLLNGTISFFLRYNFITQQRYGPSLVPMYIIGSGIGLLVVGLVFKTASHQRE